MVLVAALGETPGTVTPGLRPLLEEQARSLELPLHLVHLHGASSAEQLMLDTLEAAAVKDLRALVFPAARPSSARALGEALAARAGLELLSPLSKDDPSRISQSLLSLGFRSVVNRIDPSRLARDLLGRVYSERFLLELPAGVDPLGEDGAFDTFVCAGPGLLRPISPRLTDMIDEGGELRAVLGPGPQRAYGDV